MLYKSNSQAESIFIRIGDGHWHAVQRPWDRNVDRSLRCMIEHANNNGDCIISGQSGYYRPIPSDPVDAAEYNIYMRKEHKRIESLLIKEECMKIAYEARRMKRGIQSYDSRQIKQPKRLHQGVPDKSLHG